MRMATSLMGAAWKAAWETALVGMHEYRFMVTLAGASKLYVRMVPPRLPQPDALSVLPVAHKRYAQGLTCTSHRQGGARHTLKASTCLTGVYTPVMHVPPCLERVE